MTADRLLPIPLDLPMPPLRLRPATPETLCLRHAGTRDVPPLAIAHGEADDLMSRLVAWQSGQDAVPEHAPLASMLRAASGFRLIYADPPYASGRDYTIPVSHTGQRGRSDAERVVAFGDRWRGGANELADHLRPRLAKMRDLLTPDGSLYLHVDHRISPLARTMLDEIFGPDRLRGVIIWHTGTGAKGRRQWTQQHQEILCYARGRDFVFNPSAPELREPHAPSSLATHFRHRDPQGRRYRERTLGGRTYRYYADEGRLVGSVWTDIPAMRSTSPIQPEYTGYPTQKPLALLRRIIAASSEPGDLIGDFFAGSGTTAVAASQLGRGAFVSDQSEAAIVTMERRLPAFETNLHRLHFDCSPVELPQLLPELETFGAAGNQIHLLDVKGGTMIDVMGWAIDVREESAWRRLCSTWRSFGEDLLTRVLPCPQAGTPFTITLYDRYHRRHIWDAMRE